MLKKICLIVLMSVIICQVIADLNDEVLALKSWIIVPFSSSSLEAERDAKLAALPDISKGEFENTAQFELRKQDATNRANQIREEYAQKIADARAAYERHQTGLRNRLNYLLAQTRETIIRQGTLESYDADSQKYRVSIPEKSFQIVVPLDKAPQLKNDFGNYQLKVIRQLNDKLEWEYLEAKLSGPAGEFSSTDKAPGISPSSTITTLVPPQLSSKISFSEPSGNNMLDAEETADLSIEISNTGKGNGYMVQANITITGVNGIDYDKMIYFGELAPGKSQSKSCQISAGQNLSEGTAQLKISFSEQNGFPPEDKIIQFSTKSLIPPDIQITDIAIDDQNKNGKIEQGEQFDLLVRIQNKGNGLAKNVSTKLILGKDIFLLPGSNAENQFDQLSAGEYKDLHYTLVTAKTATNLNLTLDILEAHTQFNKLNQPLNLAFNRQERTAESIIISGKERKINIENAPALSIDVEQNIPVLSKADNKKWGVIFGIENYRNVSSVPFARRDAEFMKEYFNKVLGIPTENIYFQTDESATLSEFKTVFDPGGWLAKNAGKPGNEIYIYYSGHGAPDPAGNKAYLLPADGNPNYAAISGYGLDQLYANLAQLKVKQITLFLDSCFSGANRDNETILASARPVFITTTIPSVASNIAVFSAATGNQISSGYSDKQHGLFSYYLMKGLRGEADSNKDNKLTQKELNDYLSEQVNTQARRMGREQEPQLQSAEPERVILQW